MAILTTTIICTDKTMATDKITVDTEAPCTDIHPVHTFPQHIQTPTQDQVAGTG